MPKKKAIPQVHKTAAEGQIERPGTAGEAAEPPEPARPPESQPPEALAPPPERSGLSGEGASSALVHLIEQEKTRTDTAGGS